MKDKQDIKNTPMGEAFVVAINMVDSEDEKDNEDEMVDGCPIATQDIEMNIKNRGIAIKVANYGPMNPDFNNETFWEDKARIFKTSVKEAMTTTCSNCAAFIQTSKLLDCIKKGLDAGPEAEAIVKKANLGFCEIFDFKCAGDRTCDAWVYGGPVTDKDIKKEKK